MSPIMTKRERVERTFARRETDRVPIYDILLNDGAFAHFSGEALPPLADNEPTRQMLSRIVGKAVNQFLDMTRSVDFGPVVESEWTDGYGFTRHASAHEKTAWITHRPFSDEAGAAEFLRTWIRDTAEETRKVRHNPTDYRDRCHQEFLAVQATIGDTVNLLSQQGTGLDDIRHLVGMELFAYLQADDPGIISELLETVTEHNVAVCHAIADTRLSPAVLTYGDIACKQRLLHSPAWLRAEFFPRLKHINDAWHEHGFTCLFHSDGYLMDVMDDLIAAGIDGLNPIETVAGMDLVEVKQKYGDRIFLTGAIDMSQLLAHGSVDEVREVCRAAIRTAYPGYFIGSTTESDNSVKTENLIAMYEVVMEGLPG
jgi:hypothetical protein